jgi:hypothetical protein
MDEGNIINHLKDADITRNPCPIHPSNFLTICLPPKGRNMLLADIN